MKYIVKIRGVQGGEPIIAGTRFPAERLVFLLQQGYTEERFRKEFPHLGVKKLRGALAELAASGIELARQAS
jgi:uncharacterized protein (DUF433 family)